MVSTTRRKKAIFQVENDEVPTVELPQEEVIQMLLSGMCAQQEYIEKLQEEVSYLNKQSVQIANILEHMKNQHESFNSYIHTYVDIEGLAKLVCGIAEETGVNIEQYYTKPTIQ